MCIYSHRCKDDADEDGTETGMDNQRLERKREEVTYVSFMAAIGIEEDGERKARSYYLRDTEGNPDLQPIASVCR